MVDTGQLASNVIYMRTFTNLSNLFTNLSNNTSSDNLALGGQLISDQHRYTIQKYFDNERTYYALTVGGQDLTLTAEAAIGATSATLTTQWLTPSCWQLVVFSEGQQRTVFFTQGSASISWNPALTVATTSTSIQLVGQQSYIIPPQISKIKNDTITVGQLQYTPAPVMSIQDWTLLNALPYTSDIPNYFYIYQNQVMFWPIPSTTGNVISFNYKSRVADLSLQDYTTGTLSGIVIGSNQITGVGTTWSGQFPLNVDVTFYDLFINIPAPYGDGIWYQIQSFQSDTQLTTISPIQNTASATAAKYTIGQLPLLQEDFQDMLVYGALKIYYSTIIKDTDRYKEMEAEYGKRLDLLEAYAGTKSVNVDLGAQPIPNNPNLFIYANMRG